MAGKPDCIAAVRTGNLRRRDMGEIPSMPLSRVKLWFGVVVVASVAIRAFGAMPQVPSTQTVTTPSQQVSVPERKTLPLQQVPAELRADILMARGQYAAAIAAYQETNLRSAVVWNNIGMAYHHLFALEQARKAYQSALALNPRFAAAANNLAAVYYAQGDFHEAERWYKRALKHTSESAVIYSNLGTTYFAEAKYNKGMKAYEKAFSMDQQVFDPEHAAMVEGGSSREQRVAMNYYLAETFARVGKQEQALLYLRKAMDEGFNDRKRLVEDKDFATLRATPQFQTLLDEEHLN
jgi:tetratricopeptide (TPR) repeat protein